MLRTKGLLFRRFPNIGDANFMLWKRGCRGVACSWNNRLLSLLRIERTARFLSVGETGTDHCNKLWLPKRGWGATVLLLFLLCSLSSFLQHLWPFHHHTQPTRFSAWQESCLWRKGTKGKRTWTRRVEEERHHPRRISPTEGKSSPLTMFGQWACPCHIFSSRGSLIPLHSKVGGDTAKWRASSGTFIRTIRAPIDQSSKWQTRCIIGCTESLLFRFEFWRNHVHQNRVFIRKL